MLKKLFVLMPIVFVSMGMVGCSGIKPKDKKGIHVKKEVISKRQPAIQNKKKIIPVVYKKRSPRRNSVRNQGNSNNINKQGSSFTRKLSSAALGRLRSRVRYDGSYVKIAYPWGDVPANTGVCTDVVIRSYRKLGIDLQKQVHQDMSAAFNTYPNLRKWRLSGPDTNIDHRRVYNLRNFFARRGAGLPITRNPRDYQPGDLVSWMVGPDLPHIGIVVDRRTKADPNRFMIVHNIAKGPQMEDILFRFPITGHYRYTPAHMGNIPQRVYASNRVAPRKNGMSYNQLVQAANLLGTGAKIVSAKPVIQSNKLLGQVVRLNNTGGSVVKSKSGSMKIATLSEEEIRILLTR